MEKYVIWLNSVCSLKPTIVTHIMAVLNHAAKNYLMTHTCAKSISTAYLILVINSFYVLPITITKINKVNFKYDISYYFINLLCVL